MNRKLALIIGLQALIIILMFWVIVFYGKDEYEAYKHGQEEEIESPNRVNIESGITTITVTPASQVQSGIETTQLKPAHYQNVLPSLGYVVSIDPLIELRTRYLTAKAEAEIARASLSNSQQEYQRLSQLNQDNRNISDRAVIAAESAWKADQAKVAAAETLANNIRDNIRQLWGEALAADITRQDAGAMMQDLLLHKEVLLQITLPFESANPKAGDTLNVTPTGTQGKAVQAKFVSTSAQTDNTVQGRTFYYRAVADDLRAGMRVSVGMQSTGKSADGVMVPTSAVVWYSGKAWIYKRLGDDKFMRFPISTENETDGGWFNSGTIKTSDEIVINGAQLLLSEEFKYQIKNENED